MFSSFYIVLFDDNFSYRNKTNILFLFISDYPNDYYGWYGNPWYAPTAYHGWPYAYTVASGYPYHFNHGYGGIVGLHYNKASADQVATAEAAEPAAPVPGPQ